MTLTLGQEAIIDFPMEVSGKQETVTVTAESPVVEATRTVVSNTITQAQIETCPATVETTSTWR